MRTRISPKLVDKMLFESDHTCCFCNIPYKAIQVHHINENNSVSTYNNLIVLCLDCHSRAHTKPGLGRSISYNQLKLCKKDWLERVKKRKELADSIAVLKMTQEMTETSSDHESNLTYYSADDLHIFKMYLVKIQSIHKGQLLISQACWDEGTTMSMNEGSVRMVDFYESVLLELS
jgi:hypothetical protein